MTAAAIDPNEEETQQSGSGDLGGSQDLAQPEQTQAPTTSAPSVSSASTLTGGSAAPKQAPKGSSSGQKFSNLKRFIDKNKQSNIAGSLQKDIGKRESKVQSQVNTAQDLLAKSSAAENARIKAGETATADGSIYGEGAAAFAADQGNVDNFQNWQKGQASTLGIEGKQDIQRGLQGLSNTASNLGSEAGRFSELKNTLGRGRQYSQGASRMDQLLLQSNAGERDKLTNMRKNLGQQAGSQFEATKQSRDASQEGFNTRAEALGSGINKKLYGEDQTIGGTDGGLVQDLTTEARDKLAAESEARLGNQDIQEALRKGTLTNEQMQQLGMTDAGVSSLYGVTGNDFLNDQAALSQSSVLTGDQASRYNAISKLAGLSGAANADYLGGLDQEAAIGATGAYGTQQNLIDKLQGRKSEYETGYAGQESKLASENKALEDRGTAVKQELNNSNQELTDLGFGKGLYGGVTLPETVTFNRPDGDVSRAIDAGERRFLETGYTDRMISEVSPEIKQMRDAYLRNNEANQNNNTFSSTYNSQQDAISKASADRFAALKSRFGGDSQLGLGTPDLGDQGPTVNDLGNGQKSYSFG